MILVMELFANSMPTIKMINETMSAAIYSKRPWPNGCSSSAGLSANLNPIRLIIDEPASDKLFAASTVMAILFVIVPVMNFAAQSMRFKAMPTQPLKIP